MGFDWPVIDGVLDKIVEEIQELREASSDEAKAAEMGDLLFALVNLARWFQIDAESALRGTNIRFRERFGHIEKAAKDQGLEINDMTLDEMESFWEEAKML